MSHHTLEPRLEVVERPGRTMARFDGPTSLTEANAEALGRQFSRLIEAPAGRHVLLDLGNVQFLSSGGLGKLIGLNKCLREGGGRLTVANVPPRVRELLHVTRLDTVLDVQHV